MDRTIELQDLAEADIRKRISEIQERTGVDLWDLRERFYKHGLEALATTGIHVIAVFSWLDELERLDRSDDWTFVSGSDDPSWPHRPDLVLTSD